MSGLPLLPPNVSASFLPSGDQTGDLSPSTLGPGYPVSYNAVLNNKYGLPYKRKHP